MLLLWASPLLGFIFCLVNNLNDKQFKKRSQFTSALQKEFNFVILSGETDLFYYI